MSYLRDLPKMVQEGLLHGAVGKTHLATLASRAMEAAQADKVHSRRLEDLAFALLRASWEGDLLDAGLAAQFTNLARQRAANGHASAPEPLLKLAAVVVAEYKRPPDLNYLLRLVRKGDDALLRNYLEQQCHKEPENLFWLQQGILRAVYEGAWDWAHTLLEMTRPPGSGLLKLKLQADILLLQGKAQQAAEVYERISRQEALDVSMGQGEALLRSGERKAALAVWHEAHERSPWNVNLLLKLHDAATGLEHERGKLEGGVAVLLYTYNKAEDLGRTLEALEPSLYDGVTLLALDNGSTDATPELLEDWRGRLGEERMRIVTLPVNVGAPAARNWLLREPEVRACRWVAYIDDDAPLPEDWLERLAAAASAYPEAGVWGCRVVDASNPGMLQHVDLHLTDPRPVVGETDAPEYARRFSLSNLHHQVADQGQFCYVRPCASVTGCVHLFLRTRLEEAGGFDLRFTPSQYDDVEHDLRLAMQGRAPVYQGHLAAPHLKRTGRAAHKDPVEQSRALANLYKLQMLFSPEQIAGLRERLREMLLADVEAKTLRLRERAIQGA